MMRKLMLLISLIAFLGVSAAMAQTLDPPNFHIGTGLGTACQAGCGGHPNVVGTDTISLWDVGSGGPYLNPILLIIGIPNDASGTAAPGTITLSTGTGQLGGTNVYGGHWNTSTGYSGSWSGVGGLDVYSFVGLGENTGESNNFGNWSSAVLANNSITATSFGIYVYELSNTGLVGQDGIDITFNPGLNSGTMIIAFGCGGTACTDNPNPYTTPITEAGDAQVPEPGTLTLLGTGLLGLAGMIRRRFKR